MIKLAPYVMNPRMLNEDSYTGNRSSFVTIDRASENESEACVKSNALYSDNGGREACASVTINETAHIHVMQILMGIVLYQFSREVIGLFWRIAWHSIHVTNLPPGQKRKGVAWPKRQVNELTLFDC